MKLLRRLAIAVRHPERILPYLRWQLNRLRVKRVVRDGKVYHAYRGVLYPDELNYGNACAFITDRALRYCEGRGIDVGAGDWPLPHALPVRDEAEQNAYSLDAIPDGSLDYVFSSHCLEHLDRWRDALDLWTRKLRPGGTLFLYLPHPAMKLWNPSGPWVALDHKWKPSPDALIPFLRSVGVETVEHSREPDGWWSFFLVGKKNDPRAVVEAMARALDADDYATARPLLDPECVYEIGGKVLAGPDAILDSYAGNSESARGILDRLEFESRVVAVEGPTVTVEFLDRLERGGDRHQHRCRQAFTVGPEGRILRIVHHDLPGEAETLREYFRRVGVPR